MRNALQSNMYIDWLKTFHFKNRGKAHKQLIIYRVLSIIGLLGYSIIDTVMYSSRSNEKADTLRFIHVSQYIPVEILTIIYATGTAAFGISVEIYVFIAFTIINCIFVSQNCGGPEEISSASFWLVKMIIFFAAVELCHWNFRKLNKYEESFNSSAHAMLVQSYTLCFTVLFLNAPGLRLAYRATHGQLPQQCVYKKSQCGMANLYEPMFSYQDDACLDGLSDYTSLREQLRTLRNLVLFNIFSYACFNENFFPLKSSNRYFHVRVLLVLLFTAISTSVIVSSVDPLYFIRNCRLAYSIVEGLTFLLTIGIMILNLYLQRTRTSSQSHPNELTNGSSTNHPVADFLPMDTALADHRQMQEEKEMERSPRIAPSY